MPHKTDCTGLSLSFSKTCTAAFVIHSILGFKLSFLQVLIIAFEKFNDSIAKSIDLGRFFSSFQKHTIPTNSEDLSIVLFNQFSAETYSLVLIGLSFILGSKYSLLKSAVSVFIFSRLRFLSTGCYGMFQYKIVNA